MRRLGEYELLRKIGRGGMAEVWMGRRAAMAGASKAVAVKLLARDVLDDPMYRQMFLDEARLSMLLTNSNVVQVFDCGEVDGECFMVMEWVDGLNLAELTSKLRHAGERLPMAVGVHVVGEVLRALAYAHGLHHDGAQATIVHRDVSPHNVLVSISGEVKLADFGVARLAREETSGLHIKGKLRYMAPEQLRGRSREPTVDLYAVGAILHELLDGSRFREITDEKDLYAQVLAGDVAPLTTSIAPELEQLRAGLLEADPKQRIPTADAALELLYAWPGYRNGSVELGKLVRRWVGVEGPRSGIVSGPLPQATFQRSTPVPAAAVEAPAERRERESGPQKDQGATQTTDLAETPSAPTAVITPEPPSSGRPSVWIGAALALAIGFGVFGLGFPLGWWGAGGQQPIAAAEEVVEPPPKVEPAKKDEPPPAITPPAITPTVTPPTTDDNSTEEAEAGDGDGEPPPDLPPEKKKKEKPKGPPAEVEFNAGEYAFVWIKVAGEALPLEPRRTLSLEPGSHRVQFREDEADPWKTASTKLNVEPGKSYKVRMTKSGLTITKL